MPVPFPTTDPELWDILRIADWTWDATSVTVEGDFGNELDVQKAPGSDGAPARDKGYDPCKLQVTWTLYTESHFIQYEGFLATNQPKPGKTGAQVVVISYPLLQMYKKERFTISKIHLLKFLGKGMWQGRVDAVEWFPAPKKKSTDVPNANATSAAALRDQEVLKQYNPAFDRQKPGQKVKP